MTSSGLPGLDLLHRGKVRELYEVPGAPDLVLMVASDRISAYDAVLPTPIPDKGAVLTALSVWWFDQLSDLASSHLVTADVTRYPDPLAGWGDHLAGRSMLCRRLTMLPVECVARGYLTGSGLAEYRASGSVCGHELPEGLTDGSRLPEPIFTPTTKAPVGSHDEAITPAQVAELLGVAMATRLSELTLAIYRRAAGIAAERGILLADTKLEFGLDAAGGLVLADEVLTPDSSRFWEAAAWRPGGAQPSYDKQYVRDWLTTSGWDRQGPPPELPEDVVAATRSRYVHAYEQLTGRDFAGS